MKALDIAMPMIGAAMVAGVAAWGTVTGYETARAQQATSAEAVVDTTPAYAIEDYNYPQAEEILEEQDIILKRGDGHIVLADCASETGLLEVHPRRRDKVCFKVTGNSGWLTLEIPSVYMIKGSADHSAEVDMTVDDQEKSFDVAENEFTAVGEANDPEGREWALLEIRTAD